MRAKEIWKQVQGLSWYEVSNMGRLRSWRPNQNAPRSFTGPRLIKGSLDADGYLRTTIQYDDGTRKTVKLQKLVALAFLGRKPKGLVLAHDNGISTDNRDSNLIYKTQKANIADKERHGTKLFGERHPRSKLTTKQAKEIKFTNQRVCDLAAKFHVPIPTVSNVRNGRAWGWL
jgi:hypothetical protein